MKRIFLFLLGLFLFGGVVLAADTEVTIYCDDGYQPYSYVENGVAKGLYVDVLTKAFSKLKGYKVKITGMPWKRGLDYIKTGDGFALFPPYYRPKERPWMDFSEPILDEQVALVVREDVMKKTRVKWPDDFTDLTIGLNSGFVIIKDEDRKKLKIEEAKDTKMNLLKIGAKRIDGYVNDKVAIFDTLTSMRSMGEYKKEYPNIVTAIVIGTEAGYIGYTTSSLSKYPYKDDFKKKVDAILVEMKKNGEIDKIYESYAK